MNFSFFQSSNDKLTKELSLLRKKHDMEQESYRDSVKAWEASQNQLRSQFEELRAAEGDAQSRQAITSSSLLSNLILSQPNSARW